MDSWKNQHLHVATFAEENVAAMGIPGAKMLVPNINKSISFTLAGELNITFSFPASNYIISYIKGI